MATVAGIADAGRNKAQQSYETGITNPGYKAAEYVVAVKDIANHHFATEKRLLSARRSRANWSILASRRHSNTYAVSALKTAVCTRFEFAAVYSLLGLRLFYHWRKGEPRGLLHQQRKRRPPPAQFTSILSAALSQRKPFITTIWSQPVLFKARDGKLRLGRKRYKVRNGAT